MKKLFLIGIITLVFYPTIIYANIKCNDGRRSPSCIYCHQGCCSGHNGCMKDENGNDVEYVEEEEEIDNYYGDKTETDDNTNKVSNGKEDNYSGWLGYLGVGAIAAAGGYALKSKK